MKLSKSRPASQSPFFLIERIWAEHGLVKVLLKSGRKIHFKPREAARRALLLNRGNVPDPTKRHIFSIIEQVLPVCREALAQQETPDSKATKLMTDVLSGKLASGAPVLSVKSDIPRLQQLMGRFPLMTPHEIQVVMNSGRPPEYQIQMLEAVNKDRASEESKKIVTAAGAAIAAKVR